MHLNVLSRAATKQRTCALSDTLSARVLLGDQVSKAHEHESEPDTTGRARRIECADYSITVRLFSAHCSDGHYRSSFVRHSNARNSG